MVENQCLNASIGYEETGRGSKAGYRPRLHAQATGFNVVAGKQEQRQNDEHIAPTNDVIAIIKEDRQQREIR
jgi:hypothetical protein